MIGQRIDVGDFRIADRDVDKTAAGAHVFRLAERNGHHGGARGAVDLERARLRVGVADHAEQHCRHRNGQAYRQIAQPVTAFRGPVQLPPGETGDVVIVVFHDTLPTP